MKLSFYIAKRAKLIEPPEYLLDEIFFWAKGVLSRLIVEDKNLELEHLTEIIDINKLKKDAEKFATNEPLSKRFHVDLLDWKYRDKFPAYMSINVEFEFEKNKKYAEWRSPNIIVIYYRPAHTMDLNFHLLKTAIAHELIHVFQEYRIDKSNFLGEFGMPKQKLKNPGREYEERNEEFYPNLLSEYYSIKRWLNKLQPDDRPNAFKTFIGISEPFITTLKNGNKSEIINKRFLKKLKELNLEKWKAAVKIMYLSLKKDGLI